MTQKEITDLNVFSERLRKMNDNEYSCTELKEFILEIVSYLRSKNIDQDAHETLGKILKDSISGIANKEYGKNSKSSKQLFNSAKNDALWALEGKISQFQNKL